MDGKGPVTINTDWCKGCGICAAFCQKKALVIKNGKSTPLPDLCIACGLCELYCPDLAISVDKSQKPKKKSGGD